MLGLKKKGTSEMNKEYEVWVEVDGREYNVYANLEEYGIYERIPETWDSPADVETIQEPVFGKFVIYDCETGFEVLPENKGEILKLAEMIMNNFYWDEELSF